MIPESNKIVAERLAFIQIPLFSRNFKQKVLFYIFNYTLRFIGVNFST